MPHSKTRARSAGGSGTIRQKIVKRNGVEYTYWEARFTTGFDPATGKQKQRSITGKTQKEVAQKLRQATVELDQGVYMEPCKLTVGQWLDVWAETYLGNLKPSTLDSYKATIRNHLKPALGHIRLEELTNPAIQGFLNKLAAAGKASKSIKNYYGVLHKALNQAATIGYLRFNPSDHCTLPSVRRKEIHPLDEEQSKAFLHIIKGHRFELLYTFDLFTGLRQGEIMGLKWENVDFAAGTVTVKQQLQQNRVTRQYDFLLPKNGKSRVIRPAPFVMSLLKRQRALQAEYRLKAGTAWVDSGLVFTDELGRFLPEWVIYRAFKTLAAQIGRPDARFHDLRHTYAVSSLAAGDDIKTLQHNLGHATVSFTLDVYGHVVDQMKQASSERMQHYIEKLVGA